jgi:glycosyltransferase involved in cell wall biosynthesis
MPLFSLVISTKGRAQELTTILDSLERQTFRDFDVWVVDQNPGDDLADILSSPRNFPLRRLHRPGDCGLSRGRNVGWRACLGTYVLFPDDDCWYRSTFLADAATRLADTGADVLTGRAADETGRSINGRFEAKSMWITRRKVWTTHIEWMVFFDRALLERIGGFDEELGVGAPTPWQACEGPDILLRALASRARCFYDPDLTGHHAEMIVRRPAPAILRKGRAYGRGMGRVLRMYGWGWGTRCYWILRPLARATLALARADPTAARFYLQVALGRFEGSANWVLRDLEQFR